ncbi:MAG: hypothetical protein H6727_19085 [Myxococcales bacterium]|nr:hypothetical protein [Myxococcales bacterium]
MTWMYVAIALIVLVLFFSQRGAGELGKVLSEMIKSRDVGPFEQFLQGIPEKRRPGVYLEAIELLWERWERELAAKLVRALVLSYPDEKLGQFWLQKVIEIEPEIAEDELGAAFLEEEFKPEVAACCGAVG